MPSHTMSYDIENRMVQTGYESYWYNPSNQRVSKTLPGGGVEYYFYGVDGQRLATYTNNYTYTQLGELIIIHGLRHLQGDYRENRTFNLESYNASIKQLSFKDHRRSG